ncbi:hypothetical protein DIE23_37890 [Burkholderia sp. Bp9143]|uniref:hypothetical protein n=1 Tax=Burkholderia sp. Bp9143 TaxID=2184574 RepID=UPI000F5B00FC|nr:hypothetical protein [Burkholderia sp. Bp9143]RQR21634.1 hypothetical protein DIE23_37890 [Burkholderia sp. Bp9143]
MTIMPPDYVFTMTALTHALPSVPSAAPTIAGLPATVFGNVVSGVVGSVITLLGVLFSNWHNRRLKRDELGHAAAQRDREREMALRRDVFLPAVEAGLVMQSSIGAVTNLEMSVATVVERFQASNATFAKVAVVGAQETVTACQQLSAGLGAAFTDLSLQRGTLQQYQNRLAELDRYIAIHEGLRDSWIKVQQDLVAKGEKSAEIWTAARGHFTQHMNEINKALTERGNVIQSRDLKQLEANELLAKQLELLSPLFPPALFAMRRELQLPLDEQSFLERHMDLRAQQLAVFKDALGKARAALAHAAQGQTEAK